eukprot:SAG11_NODE_10656_length_814_cov_0.595804_2_plen_69_part_01
MPGALSSSRTDSGEPRSTALISGVVPLMRACAAPGKSPSGAFGGSPGASAVSFCSYFVVLQHSALLRPR